MSDYDPDATSFAINQHTGGDDLSPMKMLYDGQTECFKLIGKNKTEIANGETMNADQGARITALEKGLSRLQNMLWGLLSGVLFLLLEKAWASYSG